MSKKHFIALADMIRLNPDAWQDWQKDILASFCASQNPKFNRERWLDYVAGKCGPNGGAK
jgi:hypothetical protein